MAVVPTYGGDTTNYNLQKLDLENDADFGIVNANMDIIDDKLGEAKEKADIIDNFRNASGGSKNAGSDANAVKTNGIYYRWYQTGSNFPNQSGGYLYVARHQSNENYCSQVFIQENGDIFKRTNVNGTWSAWKKLASTDDIDTRLPGAMSAINGSSFKLLTTAKTLEAGVYEYRLGAGADISELPSDINSVRAPYSYAIVTVRSKGDMICVMLFNGINDTDAGIWFNQSNGGSFWGWKRLIADSQEGTYDPTLIDGGTGYTCDSKSCTYTKQGKFVHLVMLFWNLKITNGTSSMIKFSLPFPQKSGNERAYGQFGYNGTGVPNPYVGASENQLFFGKHNASTGAEEYITGAMMNGKTFQCDLWYVANA